MPVNDVLRELAPSLPKPSIDGDRWLSWIPRPQYVAYLFVPRIDRDLDKPYIVGLVKRRGSESRYRAITRQPRVLRTHVECPLMAMALVHDALNKVTSGGNT